MRDALLELWLRLLALHVEDPKADSEATARVRNQWLLASRGGFNGCVPHELEETTATPEGLALVTQAVASLSAAVLATAQSLSAGTLNLMGFHGGWGRDIEVEALHEIARAFNDLLEFKVRSTVKSTDAMPGSEG